MAPKVAPKGRLKRPKGGGVSDFGRFGRPFRRQITKS